MKRFSLILLIFLSVILVFGFSCSLMMNKEMEKTKNELVQLESPDLTRVQDGKYKGNKNTPLVKVEVEVDIKNHTITSITILKHDNGRGKSAETIVDDIVRNNSLDVELISGATISSLVIRAAVIDAFYCGV